MHNLARPTSRPLRLLSDMQAMMEETQAFEKTVLERLECWVQNRTKLPDRHRRAVNGSGQYSGASGVP